MRSGIAASIAAIGLLGSTASAEGPLVLVAPATRVVFPLTVEGLGTARANESVDIRPHISESITAIRFEESQRVEAGHVLVELEDTEARADVAAAHASLVDSESQAERARKLFETRAVSASEMDQRLAQRDALRAALAAAKARLAETRVRAPFAGRLGLRNVSLGSLVTPETVITTLDDTDTIKLDFDVPETALSRIADDLPVEAHSAAWPEVTFRGKVASVDTRVDPISRSVVVRAVVPNPEGKLRPGMFLRVKVLREDVEALVIPEQAVVPEQARQFVFVVGAGDRVEKRAIETGRRRPGQVEILAGLSEGERVVVEGTQKVRPGGTVEVGGRVEVGRDVAKEVAKEVGQGVAPNGRP